MIGQIIAALRVALGHRKASVSATVTALADVGEMDVSSGARAMIEVAVTVAALTDFEVHARPHPDGAYVPWLTEAADYTLPEGPLVWASGDLTVQGVGSGALLLDVRGVESLKFRAAGASSVVTVRKGGN